MKLTGIAFGLGMLAALVAGAANSHDPLMYAQGKVVKDAQIETFYEPYSDGTNTYFSGRWLYDHGMLEGKAFKDTAAFYDRLPACVSNTVNKGAWEESHCSAGMCLRFSCNAWNVRFGWKLTKACSGMYHMPGTGASGLDVYTFTKNAWRYVRTLYSWGPVGNQGFMVGKPGTPIQVNFPLYNGIREFVVTVPDPKGELKALPPRKSGVAKPVVFYGTSITQGGCASRPGMAFTHIVGRDLDVPTVNLGFSGSGKMDECLVEQLARIDASCYVLDTVWNMSAKLLEERYENFIRKLRKLRPRTPILLVEKTMFDKTDPDKQNVVVKRVWAKLKAERIPGIHYLTQDGIYPDDGDATVDGVHANDWGMKHYATAFCKALRPILKSGDVK